MNKEKERLAEYSARKKDWKLWGPYLAERQWGTVREDYSADGDAWNYTTHDQSRSRTYRWGEEGIAGICDRKQMLCFSLAFWNGADPILKETFFGVSGKQGNHGEDVKEYYYYLDNLPTHAYMKMLYKYPQTEYPYKQLVEESLKRSRQQGEYELLDTGIFSEDKYFDIFIEYAKNTPDDILIKITAFNQSKTAADLHIIPQLWFRNTWAWGLDDYKPHLRRKSGDTIEIQHEKLGKYYLYYESGKALFCENETNRQRLYNDKNVTKVKDGLNDFIVNGVEDAVSDKNEGTKVGIDYKTRISGKSYKSLRLRLTSTAHTDYLKDFEEIFNERIRETEEFYGNIQRDLKDKDKRAVQRQAFAGMLWNKQYYNFDVSRWLAGDPSQPAPPDARLKGRDSDWIHLNNEDVISMPDKWEYPWYAAWDLAFHCIPIAMIDSELAKKQLLLLTREWYMHPNGELPAYEWNFSD
ncbi:MAG TPA: glucosidase, partial [Ignavibacteriaceae bacterium]